MGRTKRNFSCPTCKVDFCIQIEPGKNETEIEEHFPVSIQWLEDIDASCLLCGTALEEIE